MSELVVTTANAVHNSHDATGSTCPRSASTILVHDYLLVMRGAERTFATIADLWPDAPIATLMYDDDIFGERLRGHTIQTSPLQRLGLTQSSFRTALPLMPWATSRLNVSDAALVVSSSSAFAHGVRPADGASHVCYCHAPFRYAWNDRTRAPLLTPGVLRPLVAPTLHSIRSWDRRAASRDTHYIANSRLTQTRMRQYWGVEAPVVNPPVDLARFSPGQPEDFFLIVGELVRHKRTELALEAARHAGVRVKIVGTGPDASRLAQMYQTRTEFLGRLTDNELASLYPRALALIMPNTEEFGITAVEAQACGRPVIASRSGGALETVLENETGIFFTPDDVTSLTEALRCFNSADFLPESAVRNAERFSINGFQESFARHIAALCRVR